MKGLFFKSLGADFEVVSDVINLIHEGTSCPVVYVMNLVTGKIKREDMEGAVIPYATFSKEEWKL
jgi:hypothetical protein